MRRSCLPSAAWIRRSVSNSCRCLRSAFKRVPNAHLSLPVMAARAKNVEEKVNATRAKDRIHFLGMVNRADLPDILHDASVFLSASTTEVHPISVIEAIASGLAVGGRADEAFEGMISKWMNGYAVPLDVKKYAMYLPTCSQIVSD
jgi:1,2-diacylglycerol 3-alpha-glucosyltransferase